FSGLGRIDKGCKYLSEKYPCKECHGKWLYQPVHDQCKNYALWSFTNLFDTGKINLKHHRIDHHPDEDCNGDIYPVDFPRAQHFHRITGDVANKNTPCNTEGNP